MLLNSDDTASIAAVATAMGAAVSRARLPALWAWWTRARDRRLVAELHERAIEAALGASRISPVSVEIEHELEPKRVRLHLRLATAGSPCGRRSDG